MTLALGSSLAFAQPDNAKDSDLWLQTGTRWTRSDYYGKDLNHNGRIEDNEWTVTRTTGLGKQPAWGKVPLKRGERHRWDVFSEETWEERPLKDQVNR